MSDVGEIMDDITYLYTMEACEGKVEAIKLPDPSVASMMKNYLSETQYDLIQWIFENEMSFHYLLEFVRNHFSSVNENTLILTHTMHEVNEFLCKEEFEIIAQKLKTMLTAEESKSCCEKVPEDFKRDYLDSLENGSLSIEFVKSFRAVLNNAFSDLIDKFMSSTYYDLLMRWYYVFQTEKLGERNFAKHRILGRGGFGEVYGCTKVDSRTMYAMKVLYKNILGGHVSSAINERNILSRLDHPFLLRMPYAFSTKTSLVLILDLMLGGDLLYNLSHKKHKYLKERDAKFYLCEIALGLEHLHLHHMVYHDLKPENILLDKSGHCKISDFGLTQDISGKDTCPAFSGTRGYMAPEIYFKQPHDHISDWFSYGCLMYDLLTGKTAFVPKDTQNKKDYKAAYNEDITLDPEKYSTEACDLFLRLIARKAKDRICYGSFSAKALKEHPFFKSINWDDVYKMKIIPPFKPSEDSINTFSASEIGYMHEKKAAAQKKLTEDEIAKINTFEFKNYKFWQQEIMEKVFQCSNEYDMTERTKAENFNEKLANFYGNEQFILFGLIKIRKDSFFTMWKDRLLVLLLDRIDVFQLNTPNGKPKTTFFSDLKTVELINKGEKYFVGVTGNDRGSSFLIRGSNDFETWRWCVHLRNEMKLPPPSLATMSIPVPNMRVLEIPSKTNRSSSSSDVDTCSSSHSSNQQNADEKAETDAILQTVPSYEAEPMENADDDTMVIRTPDRDSSSVQTCDSAITSDVI